MLLDGSDFQFFLEKIHSSSGIIRPQTGRKRDAVGLISPGDSVLRGISVENLGEMTEVTSFP